MKITPHPLPEQKIALTGPVTRPRGNSGSGCGTVSGPGTPKEATFTLCNLRGVIRRQLGTTRASVETKCLA